ncbi:MAG: MFS transporter [Alphaproteobacteria bacterium]|nr:MFS transporter [Alphaproteobacteria bacterium]
MSFPFRSLFTKYFREIPRGVWALGLVSMLMDTSSEMIFSLLPVYLVSVMGASTLALGFIEGIAEATASISKIFSGMLSDAIGRRKPLAVAGYGLAALTKPVFALAPAVGWIVGARFADRLGKGIRGAPRDALLGELTPPEARGASYGLRQSLDTIGAFLGPLAAIGLMLASMNNFRLVFWIAAVPAAASVALLLFAVKEPVKPKADERQNQTFKIKNLMALSPAFWIVVGIGSLGTLARFSEAFLILRAQHAGLGNAYLPVVFVVMNIVYALIAYPAGILSDRIGRRGLLGCEYAVHMLADIVLARAGSLWAVFAGIVLWGAHMGLTQGLFSAMVADTAKAEQRGTAFGLFYFVTGLALLAASVLAGWLWNISGPDATFYAGGLFAAVTLGGMLFLNHRDARKV